jgi:hypothetical protein
MRRSKQWQENAANYFERPRKALNRHVERVFNPDRAKIPIGGSGS